MENSCNDYGPLGPQLNLPIQQSAKVCFTCTECSPGPGLSERVSPSVCIFACSFQTHCSLKCVYMQRFMHTCDRSVGKVAHLSIDFSFVDICLFVCVCACMCVPHSKKLGLDELKSRKKTFTMR